MDNPVAMINVSGQNETWYYYYADAQGSIRLLSDACGSIVEGYTYWTYGYPFVMAAAGADGNWLTEDASTQTYSSVGNSYLFKGRRWDSTTQLYYYRFRDYAPMLGRFLQTDPAGYIDTMNLYAYCANNPVNWIDPWGLSGSAELASPLNYPILVELYGPAVADAMVKGGAAAAGAAAGYAAHEVGLWGKTVAFLTGTVTADRTAGWDNQSIGDIIAANNLRGGNISGCPRPPGGPDWDDIRKMTWDQIKKAAKAGKKWAKVIKKEMLKKYNWPKGCGK